MVGVASPLLLTTVQAFALAAGALPVFWLARAHTGDRRIALNLAAAYLLFPAVQWGALNDFHPVTLAIPLLLFMVWALDEERLVLALVFAVLAALAKEDVPLVIAGIGVWYGVRHRRPRAGAAIAGLGLAWTAVALYVVIPHFSGGPSPFYGRFASVGGSPSGVVRTLFEDPGRIWDAATTGADLQYLFVLLVPLLALWALEPLLALAALPVLAMNLLSDFWSMHRVEYQYVSAIVACLFAASAIGVGRLSRRTALVWTTSVLALVAVASLSGPLASLDTYGVKTRPSPAKVDAERRALALIPGDAAVSSSNAIGAHLSARERIYSFPVRDLADWVIVDVTDDWLATRERNLPDLYRAQLAALATDPAWQLVFREDGVRVYRRSAGGDRA